MNLSLETTYSAFADKQNISSGTILEVAQAVKEYQDTTQSARILIFSDETSQQIEIDFRGSHQEVQQRLQNQIALAKPRLGRGRPKLGVVSREITLLPRHWDWLKHQPGSASATLRKLVDEARKKSGSEDALREMQNRVHGFMTAIAGDLTDYEEALRALYAANNDEFFTLIQSWPLDIRNHIAKLMTR